MAAAISPEGNFMSLSKQHIDWLQRRGISEKTAIRFGLFTVPQESSGPTLAVPFIKDGKVINHKYRGPNKRFWMDADAEKTFWNVDCLVRPEIKGEPILVTEGEMDGLAAIEAGFERTVSVPNGAESNLDFMAESKLWALLKSAPKVILAGDGDAPGAGLNEQLARRFGPARCLWLQYPEGLKDINDILVHFGAEGVREIVASAKPYPVKGLYRLSGYPEPGPLRTYSVGWPELDPYFKPTPGTLTIITGVPQVGKSKWTSAIFRNLLTAYGHQAAVASFEMPVIPFLRAELRSHLRSVTKNAREADAWIEKHIVFIDQDPRDEEEEATLEWVLDRAADAVVRDGISWLLIDPWNQLDSDKGEKETGEEAQRRQIKSLKRFAKSYNVGVFVVCHPTKGINMPNGKIREPNLYDISGSAHWYNACDFGIVLDRSSKDNRMKVCVKKARFPGTGKPGEVWMQWREDRGEYAVCDAPYDNHQPAEAA
jgi:twinkle protein